MALSRLVQVGDLNMTVSDRMAAAISPAILGEGQYHYFVDVFEKTLASSVCLDKPNQEFAFEVVNTDLTIPEWSAGWGRIHFPPLTIESRQES